jgi:hypothetical protein
VISSRSLGLKKREFRDSKEKGDRGDCVLSASRRAILKKKVIEVIVCYQLADEPF